MSFETDFITKPLRERIAELERKLVEIREWVINPPKKTVVETFYVDSYIDVEEFLEWWRRGKDIIPKSKQKKHPLKEIKLDD